MLENQDWMRLIDGLVRATNGGQLEWQGDDSRTRSIYSWMASGLATSFGAGRTRLLASTTRSAYEVAAAPGGLAPHSLSVWELKGSAPPKKLGTIESSVHGLSLTSGINEALRSLWEAAAATIEPGDAVVDRLLSEFDS